MNGVDIHPGLEVMVPTGRVRVERQSPHPDYWECTMLEPAKGIGTERIGKPETWIASSMRQVTDGQNAQSPPA